MNTVDAVGFKNDSLVDHLVQFIAIVDARVFVLKEQFESQQMHAPREAGVAQELPPELVDGVCADLIRETRRLSGSLSAMHQNLSPEVIADLTYVMVAWADETLLQTFRESLPRRYKAAIERQFFGTMDAGEQVFAKISLLIGRRSQGDTALAAVYLLILSLGFRGQYFGVQYPEHDREVLARYRSDLAAIALSASKPNREVLEAGKPPGSVYSGLGSHHQKIMQIGVVIAAVWLAAVIAMEIGWRDVVGPVKRALLEVSPKKTGPAAALVVPSPEVSR